MSSNTRGRPPMNEAERKSIRLEIRLNAAENDLLSRLAKKHNLTKTDVILKAIHQLEESK